MVVCEVSIDASGGGGQASFFFFFLDEPLVEWTVGRAATLMETPSRRSPHHILLTRSTATHESSVITFNCCMASMTILARLSASGFWVWWLFHLRASGVEKRKSMRMARGTPGGGATQRWASLARWISPTKMRFHAWELASPLAMMRPW